MSDFDDSYETEELPPFEDDSNSKDNFVGFEDISLEGNFSSVDEEENNSKLQKSYDDLEKSNNLLQKSYDTLKKSYDSLKKEFENYKKNHK